MILDKSSLIANAYQHTPTKEQLLFCERMSVFLQEEDEHRCFILRGYAGTGKTTSVAALVKVLANFNFRSELLAPTGRAAKVMSQYSYRKALTIHKRIYRKRSSTSPELQFQLAPNLSENTVFIVDEASMISDEYNDTGSSILKDLLEFVYNDKNCLLLFVGDTAQLPPVGSLDSPALNDVHIKDKFALKVTSIELKEVVRQEKKSGILANATMLRNQIIKNPENPLPKFLTKNYKDIYNMAGARLVEGLEYAYRKFGMENTLVVCRSNKSANIYNEQIRARLLYREEELTGGDQIMVVKNNYFWLPENEETAFIANGDMAKVIRVRSEEERYGFRFAEATLEFMDFPAAGQISCKVMLDTLALETANLPYEESKKLFDGLNEDYSHIANKRQRMLAIKQDPFYNALQIKFSYAVTCHKAQGGQWDAIFADQGYLTEEMIDLDFLRWLYTAVTRAKKELYLVNFAPQLFAKTAQEDYF
ncbi:ATP-dependent endonuclease [Pedobacter changchengzhani]|uniref:ATP-dependent endonuclease n=1 Tax=Pedobacter changchengzhani TaxID=2529274 RepID=A0A4R5MMI1_9SPHI|nr:AAA family ATPase [Pedobacter changchengzhani]TDG36878.1 ATP-dependent endonuclease [Pedobacter changchengzhani]